MRKKSYRRNRVYEDLYNSVFHEIKRGNWLVVAQKMHALDFSLFRKVLPPIEANALLSSCLKQLESLTSDTDYEKYQRVALKWLEEVTKISQFKDPKWALEKLFELKQQQVTHMDFLENVLNKKMSMALKKIKNDETGTILRDCIPLRWRKQLMKVIIFNFKDNPIAYDQEDVASEIIFKQLYKEAFTADEREQFGTELKAHVKRVFYLNIVQRFNKKKTGDVSDA